MQYEVAFNEGQQSYDLLVWVVGRQLLLELEYCDAMDWPASERPQFDFEPAGLYGTVTVLV